MKRGTEGFRGGTKGVIQYQWEQNLLHRAGEQRRANSEGDRTMANVRCLRCIYQLRF